MNTQNTEQFIYTLGHAYEAAHTILKQYGDNESVMLAILANLIFVSENGKINEENN
jgi:hypothetical protein